MKGFLKASVVALMCLWINSFAGNNANNKVLLLNDKLNDRSFDEIRSFAENTLEPKFRMGAHIAIGYTGYWDCPPKFLAGNDDWGGFSTDLGLVFKLELTRFLSVLTELNFGLNYASREIAKGSTRYGSYTEEEGRTIFHFSEPFLLRYNPSSYGFFEAGMQFNINFATGHSRKIKDEDGNSVYGSVRELPKWNVTRKVPSLVLGLGLSGSHGDIGVRMIWDLCGINENEKIAFYDDGKQIYFLDEYERGRARNDGHEVFYAEDLTKVWAVQFFINGYFL